MTPHHRTGRTLAALALGLTLIAGAAGCGSSDDESGPTTTTAEAGSGTDAGSTTTAADGSTTTGAPGSTTTGDDEPTTSSPGDTPTTEGGDDPATTTPSGGTGDRQAYVDALAAELGTDETLFGDPEQSACLAGKIVDVIGPDVMVAAGISPATLAEGEEVFTQLALSEDEANRMYDGFAECGIDVVASFKSFASEDTPDATEEACLDRNLTDEALRAFFTAGFRGEVEPDTDPLQEAFSCVND